MKSLLLRLVLWLLTNMILDVMLDHFKSVFKNQVALLIEVAGKNSLVKTQKLVLIVLVNRRHSFVTARAIPTDARVMIFTVNNEVFPGLANEKKNYNSQLVREQQWCVIIKSILSVKWFCTGKCRTAKIFQLVLIKKVLVQGGLTFQSIVTVFYRTHHQVCFKHGSHFVVFAFSYGQIFSKHLCR